MIRNDKKNIRIRINFLLFLLPFICNAGPIDNAARVWNESIQKITSTFNNEKSQEVFPSDIDIRKSDPPNSCFTLATSIPDYCQYDKAYGGFPNKGISYCGPSTVSNSLIWFAFHGFPSILDSIDGNLKKVQHELIISLGTAQYLNTGTLGSDPNEVCTGTYHYLKKRGIDAVLQYQGWRDVDQKFMTGQHIPHDRWIKDHVMNNDAVWLNIGWYDYHKSNDTFIRTGGHWVTLAGYGYDGKKEEKTCYIIHDPATRKVQNDMVVTLMIGSGTLTGDYMGLPQNALGYRCFRTGDTTFGVIEGAIALLMPSQVSQSSVQLLHDIP